MRRGVVIGLLVGPLAVALTVVLAAPWLVRAVPVDPPPPAAPLTVRGEDQSLSLAGHLEVLSDPGGGLGLDDLRSGPAAGSFRPIPGFLAHGFVSGATWVRIRLRYSPSDTAPAASPSAAPAAIDRLLEMKPPYLNELRVYAPAGDDDGAFVETVLGDGLPYAGRPIPFPSLVVPVTLRSGRETVILIRIATARTTALSLRLWSPSAFMTHATLDLSVLGAWFGIAVMIGTINLVFWLWLRDRVYGWYGLYVLAMLAGNLPVSGMLFLLWPSGAHRIADWLIGTALCAVLLFGALFTGALFDLRRGNPVLRGTITVMVAVGLAGTLVALAGQYAAIGAVIQFVAAMLFILAALLSLRLALRGHRQARLWLLAFLLPLVGGVMLLLRNVGLLPMIESIEYGNMAGALFHMLLMTLSLAQRVKQAERDWREAQQAALAAARDAEEHAQTLAAGRTRQLMEATHQLEEALMAERQAARDRTQFVDMISHEYRTPLSVISASLDVLALRIGSDMDGVDRSGLERPLARMRRAVHRLVEIVDVGLQRARIDVDGLAATRKPMALSECLDEALSIVRSHSPDRVIVLTEGQPMEDRATDGWAMDERPVGGGAADVMLLADRPLLTTVFVNLLDNALKYSPADRPVRIGVTMAEGWLRVEVNDRGMGIAEADLPRVFGKFFRSQQAQSMPGTGIGLALARRIVELHGGRLSLASRIGVGTTATVEIPALDMGAAGAPAVTGES
ncbi:sensor histidine kinase [Azospirillum sp. B510]|uniref:sensor histidine kinase n=1 Tax=Azospirillum sp. (strain B510) TaxID=137722 RepID=UPI0011D10F6E|nr:sensor histidine kinase [Azospirillum sp. B510]